MNLSWRRLPKRWAWLRNAQANLRDTLVLLNEFKSTIFAFSFTLVFGGWLYMQLSARAGQSLGFIESTFLILSMIFLQANSDFPAEWYRQIFFFAMPVIGLALIARGADFGVLLFNRRLRGEAWQVAAASTFSNHVVLIGLGHLGFRVTDELHKLSEDVVVVEQDPQAALVQQVETMEIPIIKGDATKPATLEAAGVARARAIIMCTSNDTLNLQMAIKARTLNQTARIMVRVFDEDFARQIENQFGINYVFSASTLAAPSIAGAATQSDVSSPIALSGRTLSLARFVIKKSAPIANITIEEFENKYDVTVVLLERNGKADLHPHNNIRIIPGDNLAVFAEPSTLNRITRVNR
jgi:Trk K+ transport system NAD-binding subunit